MTDNPGLAALEADLRRKLLESKAKREEQKLAAAAVQVETSKTTRPEKGKQGEDEIPKPDTPNQSDVKSGSQTPACLRAERLLKARLKAEKLLAADPTLGATLPDPGKVEQRCDGPSVEVTERVGASPVSVLNIELAAEPIPTLPTTKWNQGEEVDQERKRKRPQETDDGTLNSVAHSKGASGLSPSSSDRPVLQRCRRVDKYYEKLNKIDEGTYGVVWRARSKETGAYVALKQVKTPQEREGFPVTALREVATLLSVRHPHIVDVIEVVMSDSGQVFMVMEFMEHDFRSLMDSMPSPFTLSEVKCLMLQLLSAVAALHDNWVIHRDLKSSNLLMNNNGVLKVCDFGLARFFSDPMRPCTPRVVTLWYRAPELLLECKEYTTAIDMWSCGCLLAEFVLGQPLFPAKSEAEAINKIISVLGTPTEEDWPGWRNLPLVSKLSLKKCPSRLSDMFPKISYTGNPYLPASGLELLTSLLAYDPSRRLSARDALNHPFFSENPLPKHPRDMPTYPSLHETGRRKAEPSSFELEQQALRDAFMQDDARFSRAWHRPR